ncbi:unnamed protein product [Spirodela intermedia]|uniref:Uncharacterized protein n=2 Tax=Spirodela intermedia TaxID=51605 RepID=A0A7I8IBW5_SPIIN|nr:unnamed protein product [Spirodela intermedia]CAA6654844.1 unnamed protein product [Spirodela intermedia]CAA7389538.1 unnamed protein product [Spirodela intermedia]
MDWDAVLDGGLKRAHEDVALVLFQTPWYERQPPLSLLSSGRSSCNLPEILVQSLQVLKASGTEDF